MPLQKVAIASILCAALAMIMIDLTLGEFDSGRSEYSQIAFLIALGAVFTAIGVVVMSRLSRRTTEFGPTVEFTQITIICPHCKQETQNWDTVGYSQMAPFMIEIIR